MIITILCLVGGAITFGDRSGILLLQSISETHFRSCMLRSGKSYQSVSEMSEVTDLLKAWMEETHKQELRHEEERRRYEQERAEEKRRYERIVCLHFALYDYNNTLSGWWRYHIW